MTLRSVIIFGIFLQGCSMGVMPTPTEYGDDCLLCFDAGKTPVLLKAFISGVERGASWLAFMGEPPNGYHDLVQDDTFPCTWYKYPWVYPHVWLHHHEGHSHLRADNNGDVPSFVLTTASECMYSGANENNGAGWEGFSYGHINISVVGESGDSVATSPLNLVSVMEQVQPVIGPDPRFECFPTGADEVVIRYAEKSLGININMKYEPP